MQQGFVIILHQHFLLFAALIKYRFLLTISMINIYTTFRLSRKRCNCSGILLMRRRVLIVHFL